MIESGINKSRRYSMSSHCSCQPGQCAPLRREGARQLVVAEAPGRTWREKQQLSAILALHTSRLPMLILDLLFLSLHPLYDLQGLQYCRAPLLPGRRRKRKRKICGCSCGGDVILRAEERREYSICFPHMSPVSPVNALHCGGRVPVRWLP